MCRNMMMADWFFVTTAYTLNPTDYSPMATMVLYDAPRRANLSTLKLITSTSIFVVGPNIGS